MKLGIEVTRDYFLLGTEVENIFINEYLPIAPGDYVKVYLYALFLAKQGLEIDIEVMARHIMLEPQKITEALEYWVGIGAISKAGKGEFEFLSLREKLYGNCIMKTNYAAKDEISTDSYENKGLESEQGYGAKTDSSDPSGSSYSSDSSYLSDSPDSNAAIIFDEGDDFGSADERQEKADNGNLADNIRETLSCAETVLGRPLSAKELREVSSWLTEIGATKELSVGVIEYCAEMGKTSINYMAKVLLQWNGEGLKTKDDISAKLSEISERQGDYRRILNMLGLNRNITVPEKRLIDNWIDVMHFEMKKIMDACEKASFTANPNLKYVNKVLENWKQEADSLGRDVNSSNNVSMNTLNKYYDHIRRNAEAAAEKRKEEVYDKVPEIRQIDINLSNLSSKISRGLLGGSSRQSIEEIKKEVRGLEQERAILLTENNFPYDYTDMKYLCVKCSDTGIDENGQRCGCVKERMGEASLWQDGKL